MESNRIEFSVASAYLKERFQMKSNTEIPKMILWLNMQC
jgi:hypothetical protein